MNKALLTCLLLIPQLALSSVLPKQLAVPGGIAVSYTHLTLPTICSV